ncbi:MAG: protein kinase [Oscillospiraceae bacterium]|nr:protein kinase [Oscillospiraceae bacterium]
MSEPKLISPLLDGFVMGDPISSHHGVRCCPAMQADSNGKYIVKIISVPASQSKLDALLLAGAFSNTDSALSYFRDLADGIVEEAVLLQRLSRLEGFISYDKWQVVSMEDGEVGFDVYLSSAYRPTLDRVLRKESMTHLSAVNLGLDLCAALSVCRRSGYLYVDLKPENVTICQENEYRICDLGFIPLSSLAYASLPERYLSAYTAPEIADAYSALNTTMDVYAAGLILYQAYNGGTLPFEGRAPAEPLPVPQYADSEMAQIILKACDPNPEVRWQDPLQMGKALVSYMQSHTVNDTSIVVPPVPVMLEVTEEESVTEDQSEPSTDEILAEVDMALDAVGVSAEDLEPEVEEASGEDPVEITPEPEKATIDIAIEEIGSHAEAVAGVTEQMVETAETSEEEETSVDEAIEETEKPVCAEEADEDIAEEVTEDAAVEAQTSDELPDFTAEATAIRQELGVSEEVSQILAQAESLICHEAPDPVVAPEPVEILIPAPIVLQEDAAEEAEPSKESEEAEAEEEADITESSNNAVLDQVEEEYEELTKKPKNKHSGWIAVLICLFILASVTFGGYLFYEHYYLQTIQSISLKGSEDRLTVLLDTDVEDSLLTVHCTDTYGNTVKKSVVNGKAEFHDLNPGTRYKISVSISGYHKLIGATTGAHTTAEQTVISNFTAVTGAEDGSVILNFTVQGPETGDWKVTCSAQGEESKFIPFTGHMVTVTGLTVGKEYTFRLEPATQLYVVGTNTVTHTASNIIFAEELTIQGFYKGALIATWHAPEGIAVQNWIVRCYNDKGYDKTFTTDELKAVFEDLDVSAAYTVEVTAEGMTQGTRTFVSANSVTVGEINVDHSDRNQLSVSWDFEGTTPAGGWLLLYTIDGSSEQLVVQCAQNAGIIAPVIPGSRYDITVQPANGSTVFGGTGSYEAPAAQAFSGYLLSAADMYFQMCKTPENPEWGRYDVPAKDYRNTFTAGENASFAVYLNHEYNTSPDIIVTLFIIRDENGKIVSTATQSRTWTSMWYRGFGRINIPSIPTVAGNYSVEIYFNGAHVTTQPFSIA